MNILNLLKRNTMDNGIIEYKNTSNALLLDVRTKEEYQAGHVQGSKNMPLQLIDQISSICRQKDKPIFVYCHSGSRSSQATRILNNMGYTNVKNIGGIMSYSGKVVK